MPVREVEGHTLRLSAGGAKASQTPRVVRLSLVQRSAYLGPVFNVRECRAEADPQGGLRLLGTGRLLAWRWGDEAQARRELAGRRRLLEDLGYTPAPGHTRVRGPWDWLRELLDRELRSSDPAHAAETVREALVGLGLRADSLLDGLAYVLGLSPQDFRHARVTAQTLPPIDALTLLLPAIAEHLDPEARQVAQRWIDHDAVIFDLPRATVVRWLRNNPEISARLSPRLRLEALALLGPDDVSSLARDSEVPGVRAIAQAWLARVESG